MGKFFDNFKGVGKKIDNRANSMVQNRNNRERRINNRLHTRKTEKIGTELYDDEGLPKEDIYGENDLMDEGFDGQYNDDYNDVNIQAGQKPESFHHYLLDNKFREMERSIRGYKDVYNKATEKWEIKRKEEHCFTDEEAESIVKMLQSLLSPDIKLSFINKEAFGMHMNLLWKRIRGHFRRIAEYQYGRYGDTVKQGRMKLENLKILIEVTERVRANYSMAIQGMENKSTHGSVRSQESLQNSGQINDRGRSYS